MVETHWCELRGAIEVQVSELRGSLRLIAFVAQCIVQEAQIPPELHPLVGDSCVCLRFLNCLAPGWARRQHGGSRSHQLASRVRLAHGADAKRWPRRPFSSGATVSSGVCGISTFVPVPSTAAAAPVFVHLSGEACRSYVGGRERRDRSRLEARCSGFDGDLWFGRQVPSGPWSSDREQRRMGR